MSDKLILRIIIEGEQDREIYDFFQKIPERYRSWEGKKLLAEAVRSGGPKTSKPESSRPEISQQTPEKKGPSKGIPSGMSNF